MASRPLPPGRRGRGGRTVSAQHLPEIKILNVEQPSSNTTASSYVEQLRVATGNDKAAAEPEHESNAQEEVELTPVRSVKAFVATLDQVEEPIAAPAAPVAVVEGVKPLAAAPEIEVPLVVMSPPAVDLKSPVAQPAVHIEPEIQTLPGVQVQPSAPTVIEQPAIQSTPLPPVHEVYAPVPTVPIQAAPVAPTPTAVKTAPPSVEAPVVEGFHPFLLLLPVYSVPVVPEQVECVYDDEAVEMQKTIMKVIKKYMGKDRAKLEDFKINSRLYGNNFMDAHEYLDSLAKDLGGNRALQLVPCLLSIQPDFMKRNSLLVAARNYRMRNHAKLEAALDSEAAAVPEPVQPVTQPAAPVSPTEPVAPVVASSAATVPVVATLVEAVIPPIPSYSVDVPVVEEHVHESVTVAAEGVTQGEETKSNEAEEVLDADTDERTVEQPAICEAEPPADLYLPPVEEVASPPATVVEDAVEDAVVDQNATVTAGLEELGTSEVSVEGATPIELPTTEVSATFLHTMEMTPFEVAQVQVPVVMDEPKAAASLTPVTIDVSPIELGSRRNSFVSAQSVASPTPSENASTSSAEADGLSLFQEGLKPVQPAPVRKQSTLNLFGEDIGDDDDDDEDDEDEEENIIKIATPVPVSTGVSAPAPVPSSPPSSTSSFFEAESLFGEVIPVKVSASPAPHAKVPSIIAPAPLPPPAAIRPQHSGMLFGFGTAGDDSDSDSDSEFSD